MDKPDCTKCVHSHPFPSSSHHKMCAAHWAEAAGDDHGILNGWFLWPLNFDPRWLLSCNSYSEKEEDKTTLDWGTITKTALRELIECAKVIDIMDIELK